MLSVTMFEMSIQLYKLFEYSTYYLSIPTPLPLLFLENCASLRLQEYFKTEIDTHLAGLHQYQPMISHRVLHPYSRLLPPCSATTISHTTPFTTHPLYIMFTLVIMANATCDNVQQVNQLLWQDNHD